MEPARVQPGPGQESVWDYPRPPRLEPVPEELRVQHAGEVLARTTRGWRVLETSQAPAYYLPLDDIRMDLLVPSTHRTFCEWKGTASYFDLALGGSEVVPNVAWTYPDPVDTFAPIRDHLAFYSQRVDACFVGDEQVTPMDGGFYGGWITSKIVGPIKGGPGTAAW